MGSQVGWVCSFCSFSGSLGKASNPLPHTFSPHIPALIYEPHHLLLPLPTPCHLLLFSTGSDNESDEEVTGKKSFSAQVFLCPPLPHPWTGSVLGSRTEGRPWLECKLGTLLEYLPCPWLVRPTDLPHAWGLRSSSQFYKPQKACRARDSNLEPPWASLWKGCGMCGERTGWEQREHRSPTDLSVPLARSGNTSVRERKQLQWWIRSWPRRRTGSSRGVM